ncbi:hypothetical protein F4818DRAFT_349549 [Hypoxylon cercidicola]|nr:hypothetical protein F4818DRAFT_349549 [Hypoxylon cercidicola]
MTEVIATLSLVCNVMQVVSFAGEVLGLYQGTFRDGSPEPDLASNIAHLSSIFSTLEQRTNEFDPIYSTTNDASGDVESERQLARIRLKNLAPDFIHETKEIQALLAKVATTPSAGRPMRLWNAAKFKIRYQTQISSLEKRINGIRDVINSELLSRICSSTQAMNCRSEEEYSSLNENIKQFVDRWSKGRRVLSELVSTEAQMTRDHVTAEANLTRHHITLVDRQLVSESSRRQLEETRKRLLSTLFYPEMNERENSIEEASDDFVNEIFQKSEVSGWLQSGAPIFWINGKAGCGKSTRQVPNPSSPNDRNPRSKYFDSFSMNSAESLCNVNF